MSIMQLFYEHFSQLTFADKDSVPTPAQQRLHIINVMRATISIIINKPQNVQHSVKRKKRNDFYINDLCLWCLMDEKSPFRIIQLLMIEKISNVNNDGLEL